MKKIRYFLFLGAVSLLPLSALACPLCQAGGTKRTQKAYNETTLLLALLPITGTGAILLWMRSKRRQMESGG